MAQTAGPTLQHDIVCPFCGLACDDLVIEVGAGRLAVRQGACPISKAQFERPMAATASPRLGGARCEPADAIAKAADILRQSRQPLFAGLATDTAGMRAVLQLADRLGGIVDHGDSDALFRDLTAARDLGTITTTLSEVRNRADVVLIVGPDPRLALPRFFERCLDNAPSMFGDQPLRRQLFRLGPASERSGSAPAAVPQMTEIPCPPEELPAAVANLRELVDGRPRAGQMLEPGQREALLKVGEALKAAKYGVIAWSAGLLDFEGADLAVVALTDLIRDLNRNTRCSGLPLGGAGNLVGVNQVCLWQSGFPLRTSFAAGFPQHDPYIHSGRRLIESGEADALVWISAINGNPPPAFPAGLPTIVLATPETPLETEPSVFLPVARPGIDHTGQLFRADGVVSLRLKALRSSALASVAATLRGIEEALTTERIGA
jgi:formylmethanofuran dehydrogenase subunit B